ncbi:hypothetical protein FKM82_013705 [Ascaphus truei]
MSCVYIEHRSLDLQVNPYLRSREYAQSDNRSKPPLSLPAQISTTALRDSSVNFSALGYMYSTAYRLYGNTVFTKQCYSSCLFK